MSAPGLPGIGSCTDIAPHHGGARKSSTEELQPNFEADEIQNNVESAPGIEEDLSYGSKAEDGRTKTQPAPDSGNSMIQFIKSISGCRRRIETLRRHDEAILHIRVMRRVAPALTTTALRGREGSPSSGIVKTAPEAPVVIVASDT